MRLPRCPVVPRFVYDDLRAQLADLTEKYHALKVQGAVQPRPTLPAPRLPEPEPEVRAMQAASDAFLQNAAAAFRAQGKSPRDAEALAAEIRDAVILHDTAPAFPGL